MEIAVNDGVLVATPVRPRPNLDDLVSRITERNRHSATEWGPVRGREVW